MLIPKHPFETTNWEGVPKIIHRGNSGVAYWQTLYIGTIRIRMVEYSPGYKADHWCSKGHIILCTEGEMETTLADGRSVLLKKGMSYQVGDDSEAHRSSTKAGCKLFIVD